MSTPVFTDIIHLPHSSYESQEYTSSCWAFSVVSMMESESGRTAEGEGFSAWPLVHHKVLDQFDALTRGPKTSNDAKQVPDVRKIANGGIVSTAPKLIVRHGLVPEKHIQHQMRSKKIYLWGNRFIQGFTLLAQYLPCLRGVCRYVVQTLVNELYGPLPSEATAIEIDFSKYNVFTSFSHLPYYQNVCLDMPDNFDHDSFYNIPMDKLLQTMYSTLDQGHTFVWEGGIRRDVIYSKKRGYADITISAEQNTDDFRAECLNNHQTTDDHMLHIVGYAQDDTGRRAFIAKDSAPVKGCYDGLIYLYEDFVRLKTIAILCH